MSIRGLGAIFTVAAIGLVAFLFLSNSQQADIHPLPAITLVPEPAAPDLEISEKFIDRLIAEDPGIQAALQAPPAVNPATGEVQVGEVKPPKSNQDILFELMANWVYVKYRKVNQAEQAQFVNASNRKTTPWLPVGGSFSGATIESIDSEKSIVRLGDVTQEMQYVTLEPPPFDPTVPRTPEQIADAQRRYYEFYYKRFKVMGEKYNELAGRPAKFQMPPKEERMKQAEDYLSMMEKRLENQPPLNVPPPALVDPAQLDDKQRELYENYQRTLHRSPEEIRAAIEQYRQQLRKQIEQGDNGGGTGQ
jgi:hypothetical protein